MTACLGCSEFFPQLLQLVIAIQSINQNYLHNIFIISCIVWAPYRIRLSLHLSIIGMKEVQNKNVSHVMSHEFESAYKVSASVK